MPFYRRVIHHSGFFSTVFLASLPFCVLVHVYLQPSYLRSTFTPPPCGQAHPSCQCQSTPTPSQPDSGVLRGKIEEQRVMIKMGEEVRRVTSDAEWWEKGDGRRGTRYGRWETRQDMSKMGDKRQETRNMRQEMSHKEILILRHALVVFLSSGNNAVTY